MNAKPHEAGSVGWRIGFALLGIVPVAVASYIMCTHWIAVPFWDAWQTPGDQIASWLRGTLTLREMFAQHNEHRPFFQRVVYVPLAALFGWDTRREMALGFLLLCIGSAALYVLLRQTTQSARLALAGAAVMNLLVFAPRQYENLLSGTDGASFLPSIALIFAMIVNVSRCAFAMKAIVNAALAFAATYTFGNGMLLWPLAFPIGGGAGESDAHGNTRRRALWRVVYVLAAVAAVGGYFATYQHPPLAPPPAQRLADVPAILHFLLRWLGGVFLLEPAAVVGTTALLMFVALSAYAVTAAARGATWRNYHPWIVLGTFVLLSGLLAARSRLGFGMAMASDGRYAAFIVFFHVATIGLALTIYRHIGKRAFSAAGTVYVLVIIALTIWAFAKQRAKTEAFLEKRRHTQMLVRWSIAIPENPELALLSPYATTPTTIRTLSEHDVLQPSLVSDALARAVQQPPHGDSTAGALEFIRPIPDGLSVAGSAYLPPGDRPPDYVVLGYERDGTWIPWTVLESGESRFTREIRTTALPSGTVTFRAWAIDLASGRALPLQGAVTLTFPQG